MSYYRPISLTIIGCIISIVISFGWPIYGLIYSKLLFVMMKSFLPTFVSDRNFWQGMFLLLVILLGITNFIQKYVFLIAGENLTFDVRNLLYKGIMFKHLAWFDRKDRAPGILSNVLSEDIAILNGMTTEHLAILIEAYGGVIIGAAISLFYNWKMGLITCLFVPFISLGGVLMSRLAWKTKAGKINADEAKKDDPYEMSNALLSDILINYRTVIGFGDKNVDYLLEKFDSLLEEPRMTGIKQAHYTGFFFGYSQCIRFMFIGIVFYIAAVLINNYGDDQQDTYICLFTLFMAALGTGISLSSAPSVGKAKAAASKIFSIIDEPSLMDTRSDVGIKEIKRGEIEFINAEFQYPSRTQKVLDNMNLKINATMKVALVGHSGCGKSTTASLLLRLYEMTKGQLLIDGIDIKDYNIRELRKQIGIVMQEPLLFNTTIKENILYGNENADDAKVYQVAQMANAL
jgi:ATP-binding cassette, subfamily B (MDR/TAP), member 1